MNKKRPTWTEYFIEITKLTSSRSNCIKKQVGCIIVKNNRIISTGYNGTPFGITNCFDGGCLRCCTSTESGSNLDMCICLHAEENALLSISFNDTKDATLYCTHFPCLSCAKKIIQCRISKVIYIDDYCSSLKELTDKLFLESKIIVEKF
jgi:dCMP deaminase